MNKRVLLPTDYSKNALNAIRYALELYRNVRCDFYILNAFHVSGYTLESMSVPEAGEPNYEAAKKASEEGMERLMQMVRLHPQNDKHRFYTISMFNSLIEAVRHVIDDKDIDIIVMGTKGISASKARIFGTNTINVMEQIKQCPVLAVPETYIFEPPKKIVFPTDYKSHFKRKRIQSLLELVEIFESKIDVVHIDRDNDGQLNKKERENQKLLMEILEGTDYEMHFLPSEEVSRALQQFVSDNECDMLAFLNRRHPFFASLLANPLVKKLGHDPDVPILELNDN